VFVRCVFCVLSANNLSRGVLPTVVRRHVWYRNLVNEEALAHWGLLRPPLHKNLELISENEILLLSLPPLFFSFLIWLFIASSFFEFNYSFYFIKYSP